MIRGEYFNQLISTLNQTAIVSITDASGCIVFANENFCTISGYAFSELVGKNHSMLKSGQHGEEFFKNMWTTLNKRQVWTGEIQNKKKNGDTFWVQATLSAIVDENKDIVSYAAILFDITQMKQVQMMLAESNRLASLGELASGIAHEINNPLTIILGRLTIAQKKVERNDPPDIVIKELQTIERTVFRISNIVDGLKKLSREKGTDRIETFDIVQLIDESHELFAQKLTRFKVAFKFDVTGAIYVRAKSVPVSQVILNLINNSVDAVQSLKERWVTIDIKSVENRCLISIIDSGNGIPTAIASKVMNPFFTTKDPGKGTGLGLSLSKRMIEDCNGRFFYDGTKKNTTFTIDLEMGTPDKQVA